MMLLPPDLQQAALLPDPDLPELPEDGPDAHRVQPRALRHPEPALQPADPARLALALCVLRHLTGEPGPLTPATSTL